MKTKVIQKADWEDGSLVPTGQMFQCIRLACLVLSFADCVQLFSNLKTKKPARNLQTIDAKIEKVLWTKGCSSNAPNEFTCCFMIVTSSEMKNILH